jgi:hypothetical protein
MRYDPDKLIELCRQILPGDPSLTTEVRLAFEKPLVYLLAARKDRLCGPEWENWRPSRSLPWFALLRGLQRRRILFTWNDLSSESRDAGTPMRWAWVIRQGRFSAAHSDFLRHGARQEREWFLRIVAKQLDALGYVFCELSPSLSPMTLTVLERDTAHRCRELAAESGYGVLDICDSTSRSAEGPVSRRLDQSFPL